MDSQYKHDRTINGDESAAAHKDAMLMERGHAAARKAMTEKYGAQTVAKMERQKNAGRNAMMGATAIGIAAAPFALLIASKVIK